MYFTTAIALAVLTFANQAFSAPTYHPDKSVQTAKAVYFITNTEENSVVSIPIGSDGLLTDHGVTFTETGGRGLGGTGATGAPAMPDSLFSQGAVTIVDDLLFAVNAGSNTVSLFEISSEDPCKLTLIGSPKSTGGEFPVSVTYSSELKIACAANGGAVDGVSCFSVSRKTGLSILDAAPRPLGLGQKTPAMGPTNTIGQVSFSKDSRSLLVTVKGTPAINNTGFIAVYPVVHGSVSYTPIKSSPHGTSLLFGIVPLDNELVIAADPSIGAATLKIDPYSYIATSDPLIPVKNQTAICWTAYSSKVGSAYLADGGQNHIVEVDPKTGEIITDLKLTNGNRGMFDEIVGGDFLYALAPSVNGTHISVFDISGGRGSIKEVQNYEVEGLASPGLVMGLDALY